MRLKMRQYFKVNRRYTPLILKEEHKLEEGNENEK